MISKKSFWCEYFLKGIGLILAISLTLGLYPSLGLAQEKVKIVWSEFMDGIWGEENVDWIISEFEKTHPNVDVVKMYTPWPNMFDKLMSMSAAGEPPDVMEMEAAWVLSFDRLGVIQNLDARLTRDRDFLAKFAGSSLVRWKMDTKLIWWYTMAYHFIYNIDTFRQKGLEPPTGWENLKDVLRKLREPEKGKYGLALQLSLVSPDHVIERLLHTPLIQFGGRLLDDDGWPAFNNDAGVRTLEYWQSLIDEDLVYPGALETSEMTMYEMMAVGDLQLYLTGPWLQTVVRESNPDINLAFCPLWTDVTSGYVAGGTGTSLSAKSKNPDIAWQFMKHLWSDDIALPIAKKTDHLIATKAVFNAPFIKENRMLRDQPKMITDPASEPELPLPEMGDLYRVGAENIQAFHLGQKTAKGALDDAAAYWTDVIKEYLK